MASGLKLGRRRGYVVDVEFEPGLRGRDVTRPCVGPKAGPGGLGQGPESERLHPVELLGVRIVVVAFERDTEVFGVESPTGPQVRDDWAEARDKQYLHGSP